MTCSQAARIALLSLLAGSANAATVNALVRDANGQPVPDAAVVLYPTSPGAYKARASATIEQRGSEFMPYVTVDQTVTAIEFPNNEAIKHHAYSYSPAKKFEIKLYAGKPGQPVLFDQPGEVAIGCNIHDWMEAYAFAPAAHSGS